MLLVSLEPLLEVDVETFGGKKEKKLFSPLSGASTKGSCDILNHDAVGAYVCSSQGKNAHSCFTHQIAGSVHQLHLWVMCVMLHLT